VVLMYGSGLQVTNEHSDVETSTASDESSSAHPWTVVTSPTARAAAAARSAEQDDEVSSPQASELKQASESLEKRAQQTAAKSGSPPRSGAHAIIPVCASISLLDSRRFFASHLN
jgi:hypothetical protein